MSGYAWQEVTCARCDLTYTCTPANDYYDDVPNWKGGGGICEACLLQLAGLEHAEMRTLIVDKVELTEDGYIVLESHEGRGDEHVGPGGPGSTAGPAEPADPGRDGGG